MSGLPFWKPSTISLIWHIFEPLRGQQGLYFSDTTLVEHSEWTEWDTSDVPRPRQSKARTDSSLERLAIKRPGSQCQLCLSLAKGLGMPLNLHMICCSLWHLFMLNFNLLHLPHPSSFFHPISSPNVLSIPSGFIIFINMIGEPSCVQPYH